MCGRVVSLLIISNKRLQFFNIFITKGISGSEVWLRIWSSAPDLEFGSESGVRLRIWSSAPDLEFGSGSERQKKSAPDLKIYARVKSFFSVASGVEKHILIMGGQCVQQPNIYTRAFSAPTSDFLDSVLICIIAHTVTGCTLCCDQL